jgi:hypothetical protein
MLNSRNYKQLKGEDLSVGDLDDCDPIKTNADAGKTTAIDSSALDPAAAANP